ncbi:MAG: adenylyltransferase/cytidyltransferase family protein [Halarcobacter sp.]
MKNRNILVMGVFDLFHVGHLRYLEYSKNQGNSLIVGVLSDKSCLKIKSKKPIISQDQRMEIVKSLKCVNSVVSLPDENILKDEVKLLEWINNLNINAVVVSKEWEGSTKWEKRVPLFKQNGIDIIYAPHTNGISTSEIMNRILLK